MKAFLLVVIVCSIQSWTNGAAVGESKASDPKNLLSAYSSLSAYDKNELNSGPNALSASSPALGSSKKLKFTSKEFITEIDDGLTPGKLVRIQGFAPKDGDRFSINFQTSDQKRPNTNIALHLSVRLRDYRIVRNSLDSGKWGTEESAGVLYIVRGQMFEITVVVDSSQYTIFVNGQLFAQYLHRIPYGLVTHLGVDGHVSVSLVSFEESGSGLPPSNNQWKEYKFEATPYGKYIQDGLPAGKSLTVQGFVASNAERFDINFKAGPNPAPRDDVVLQISVRFNQGYIVRNTMIKGKWGNEEREGGMPISKGQMVEVTVEADKNRLLIYINGVHFAEYQSRYPSYHATSLTIDGDMSVSNVQTSTLNIA